MTYRAYGLTIGSDFALPFAPSSEQPDFEMRFGDVASTGPMVADGPMAFDVTGAQWRLDYRGEATYGLTDSGIQVRPAWSADPGAMASRLAGQLLGLCLRRQGALVLHANVVERGGSAVALMGPSGAGKTTLSRALVDAGCRLMSDDLGVFRPDGAEWRAFGGPGQLKVRAAVGDAGAGEAGVAAAGDAKHVVPAPSFAGDVPLRALYVLRAEPFSAQRLTAGAALLELVRHAHMPRSLDQTGLAAVHFEQSGEFARAVPCVLLGRGATLAELPQVVAHVLEEWQ